MTVQNEGAVPDVNQQQPVQPVVQPQVPAQPADLGNDARDKTREQFEKLLESNRRLFEENEQYKKSMDARRNSNRVFEPIQQPKTPQASSQINPQDFVEIDPVTGESYLNDAKLRQQISDINQKASRAEEIIQSYIQTSEQREIEKQNKEAYAAHPELDPSGQKFDADFNKQVRGVLIDSMYNMEDYGGRPLSFKEAGDMVRSKYSVFQPKATDTPKEEPKGDDGMKQQAAAQAQSQPQQAREAMADTEEMRELRVRTRMGDQNALARRLMNIPHTSSDADAS